MLAIPLQGLRLCRCCLWFLFLYTNFFSPHLAFFAQGRPFLSSILSKNMIHARMDAFDATSEHVLVLGIASVLVKLRLYYNVTKSDALFSNKEGRDGGASKSSSDLFEQAKAGSER